jgi:hypothetical protein
VFYWCGEHSVHELSPEPKPLSFVLSLVERLRWQGEFFGVDLGGGLTFQVCAEYDRPLWLRAELLDTATLMLSHARFERAHVVIALHAGYVGLNLRDALTDSRLRWERLPLGKAFAA